MNRKESRGARFHRRDTVEITVGARVMAFPVATTEEIWNLGAELALGRVLLFACASLLFLAAFIFVLHGHLYLRCRRSCEKLHRPRSPRPR